MDVWVKDLKTGKTWKLDEDSTKPVYEINRQLQMELILPVQSRPEREGKRRISTYDI